MKIPNLIGTHLSTMLTIRVLTGVMLVFSDGTVGNQLEKGFTPPKTISETYPRACCGYKSFFLRAQLLTLKRLSREYLKPRRT